MKNESSTLKKICSSPIKIFKINRKNICFFTTIIENDSHMHFHFFAEMKIPNPKDA